MRSHQPQNLEFPLSALKDATVPNEQFFVRSHFAVPEVKVDTWKLQVEGAVEKPLELNMDQIVKLPTHKLTATIECAGNGRVFIVPAVSGVQWGQGAVSNAVWEGVPLPAILERAGVKKPAIEVILEGVDSGQINSDPKSPGPIHFARSMPIQKAKSGQVLLAYKMNGQPLPISHGFPMRAVVGGWYGMASVKWLTRIVVTDKPFNGFFSRSTIRTSPPRGPADPCPRNRDSTEGGSGPAGPARSGSGRKAVSPLRRRLGRRERDQESGSQLRWRQDLGQCKPTRRSETDSVGVVGILLATAGRGRASILVRATDDKGRTQPTTRDRDRLGYMINHLVPTTVTVR